MERDRWGSDESLESANGIEHPVFINFQVAQRELSSYRVHWDNFVIVEFTAVPHTTRSSRHN